MGLDTSRTFPAEVRDPSDDSRRRVRIVSTEVRPDGRVVYRNAEGETFTPRQSGLALEPYEEDDLA